MIRQYDTLPGSAPTPWFNGLVIYVALATVGIKWFIVLTVGRFQIELSNFGSLMLLGLMGLGILLFRQFRAPMILNVQLILLVLLLASFTVNGEPSNVVVMSLAATLGAYAISNAVSMRDSTPVLLAFLTFFGFFIFSALLAGVDLIGGFSEYLVTGNRDRFNFWVLRPVYNAFSQSDVFEDDDFRTQLNNSVSATYAIFYILAGSYALNGEKRMIPVAMLSLIMVLSIFSSSAVLTCILASAVFVVYYLRAAKGGGPYVLIVLGLLLVLVTGPLVLDYLTLNLNSDSDTRAGRLIQYSEALDSIEDNMLFGVGLTRVHRHYVHNFFLFSLSSIGIIGAICAGYILLYAALLSISGMRAIIAGAALQPELLMVTCLPILFLVRASVGGGGGLPTGGGLVALALALVARRALHSPPERRLIVAKQPPQGAS
ncbi:O-antigen ligase family protein [Amaricoccus tamworthensis]|uniref:O-antigen ligase family protein n=1 Tax=Amaricoccus tamworthensis TaxID=57002 RepID=UPI003C7A0840